jgi:DNA-binding GntR family transcriptional regulator
MDPHEALVRPQSLSQQIEQILIDRIHSGKYAPDSQLPAEVDLAVEFKVSRATIRSALNTLSTLGLVVRRHGAGTFITQLPRISNPLDQAIDFQELISVYCCQPSFQQVYSGLETVSSTMADLLQIPVDSEVLVSHKVFVADEEPMIFCTNTLAVSLFEPDLLAQVLSTPEMLEPLFTFLEQKLDLRVEYYVAQVRPVNAINCHFYTPLPMPDTTPVLEIDEVAYTAEGRPIFHTYEYHPENKMNFELIRRRVHR